MIKVVLALTLFVIEPAAIIALLLEVRWLKQEKKELEKQVQQLKQRELLRQREQFQPQNVYAERRPRSSCFLS